MSFGWIGVYWTHIFSCFFMTGVIWMVQLVHYPAFRFVSESQFLSFNQFHQRSITYVVAPLMVVELISGLLLLWKSNLAISWCFLFLMLIGVWMSTFFLSVPIHEKLISEDLNRETIKQLVQTNWPRTILWSLRSLVLIFLLYGQFSDKLIFANWT